MNHSSKTKDMKKAKAVAKTLPASIEPLPARQQLTHQRIVDAASSLFNRDGIAMVRVEDILLEANISRRTFYQYFSGKDDVLKAIVIPIFESMITRFSILDAFEPEIVLEEILRCYFQQWQNAPEALMLAFNIGKNNFALVQFEHDKYVKLLAALIKRIQQQNVLLIDDQSAASMLIGRTVVPVLQSLQKTREFEKNFLAVMKGMLLRRND